MSLTPAPGGDRTEEVQVAQQILQSLGLRSFTPQVTSCPGCGRTTSTFFQDMARPDPGLPARADAGLAASDPGVEEMKVAVMGCVVNGPGESKHANIGISLPGTFEEPKAPVFVDGRLMVPRRARDRPGFLVDLENYVASRHRPDAGFGAGAGGPELSSSRRKSVGGDDPIDLPYMMASVRPQEAQSARGGDPPGAGVVERGAGPGRDRATG